MLALLKKEIRTFLSSLIGYIVIAVFLLLVSLFMWVFPGDWNTLDAELADLDTLFYIAPWVFMFLVPAITMRSLSEEKRTGTIELLLTKPLSDLQIVLAKYLGGLTLVLISLLPTLIYFGTVYMIGNPVGNVDNGGTWGSYIGLLLLGSAFVSIGIFTSSVTPNQIVSFLVSAILCFFLFIGFESLGSFDLFGPADELIISLGMYDHYKSLSRGLIDSRDVMYFVGLTALFLVASRTVLQSRKW
ncbi:MAG: gliding motility-associated ABC transporter permease subunit GldF [Flavobacteriales bacterium]|nr:gliding motility-associated ABC transporter permease subunit GldF [Flavobacteriales bacterium]MDG1781209.1 gliding motility-associated ABC transporter permease subunit GldF [Flavobacteriales bacterium]MDG2245756.1 gliding motility-associated ABC transporter permease subunit GldF [Flavobacteriales bacterium]